MKKGSITYDVLGYTKDSYDGAFITESTKISCQSESGKVFTTSKLNHSHQKVDADVLKELKSRLTKVTKSYALVAKMLGDLENGEGVKKHLVNTLGWVRAFKGKKTPNPEMTSEFQFAYKQFDKLCLELSPKTNNESAGKTRKVTAQYTLSDNDQNASQGRQRLIDRMVALRSSICPVVHYDDYKNDVSAHERKRFIDCLTDYEQRSFRSYESSYLRGIAEGRMRYPEQEGSNRAMLSIFRSTTRNLSKSCLGQTKSSQLTFKS